MRLDQKPVFREVIVPQYDSETICYVLIILMLFVFLFGILGIYTALSIAKYHEYIWVPAILVIMSGWVIFSISIRLIKRYVNRYSQ